MDLCVLDPALFAPQTQHTLLDSSYIHQDLLLAETLNNQPRLPNQIGGVTIASVHSHDSARKPCSSSSHPQDLDQTSTLITIPYGCVAQEQNNATDLRLQHLDESQQAIPYHHQITAPSHSTVYSDLPHIQSSEPTRTITRSRSHHGKTTTGFPKFHCGEAGCKFYRTDGTNLNGRYAMAKHYKQAHSDLQFDHRRLVSSHTGQKSHRMISRTRIGRDETSRVPSPRDLKSAPIQHIPVEPAILAVSASDIPQHAYYHKSNVNSEIPQQYRHNPASLPSLTEKPFTNVPDLRLPEKELKRKTCITRNACDFEMLKVRKLLLSHCRMTRQSDEQFLAMRRYLFNIWIGKARDYITRIAGPFDADLPGVGAYNDLVIEVGTMFFSAIQRCYLPRDGIMTGGAILDRDEGKRRKLCCELQAINLCFEFCQIMSDNCGRMCHSYRMGSQADAISRAET